jgi:type II secretory pathway pseudopilin PulG
LRSKILLILGGIAIVVISFVTTLFMLRYFDETSARDRRRKADLATLQSALEAYFKANGSYRVKGGGWQGTGAGYVDDHSPNSPSIAEALYRAGYLSRPSIDDLDPSKRPNYMIYVCDPNQYSISATLERPTQSDVAHIQATCNGTGANGTYSTHGKNYAVGN